MKTLRLPSLFLSIIYCIVFLSSCSDDDPTPNRIVIDGEGLALDKGYIGENENPSLDDDGVNGRYYQLLFLGPGLDINTDGELDGVGDFVFFVLFSPSTTEFKEGTYTVENDEDLVSTFQGIIYEGFDIDGLDVDQSYEISSGSITVKKSGEKYIVSFKFKVVFENLLGNPDVVDVTGQYTGTLTLLED